MFSAVRALALGEDLRSDPVSTALGLGLAAFTRGHLAISGQLLSQARRPRALADWRCIAP